MTTFLAFGGRRRKCTSAGTDIGVAPVREEHREEREKGRGDDDEGDAGEEYSGWTRKKRRG